MTTAWTVLLICLSVYFYIPPGSYGALVVSRGNEQQVGESFREIRKKLLHTCHTAGSKSLEGALKIRDVLILILILILIKSLGVLKIQNQNRKRETSWLFSIRDGTQVIADDIIWDEKVCVKTTPKRSAFTRVLGLLETPIVNTCTMVHTMSCKVLNDITVICLLLQESDGNAIKFIKVLCVWGGGRSVSI